MLCDDLNQLLVFGFFVMSCEHAMHVPLCPSLHLSLCALNACLVLNPPFHNSKISLFTTRYISLNQLLVVIIAIFIWQLWMFVIRLFSFFPRSANVCNQVISWRMYNEIADILNYRNGFFRTISMFSNNVIMMHVSISWTLTASQELQLENPWF